MTARIIRPCESEPLPRICARRLMVIRQTRRAQGMSVREFSERMHRLSGHLYTPRKITYAESVHSGTHMGDDFTYLTDAANALGLSVYRDLMRPPAEAIPNKCPYCTIKADGQFCLICLRTYRNR